MIINVYRIYNLKNKKSYIGITKNSANERISKHFNDLKNGKHHSPKLQNSYNKYGSANFNYEVIGAFDVSIDDISKLENDFIDKFNSIENGYNCVVGGYGSGIKSKRETFERTRKFNIDSEIIIAVLIMNERYPKFPTYTYIKNHFSNIKHNYKNIRSLNGYNKERDAINNMNLIEKFEIVSKFIPMRDILEYKKNESNKSKVSVLKNYIKNNSPYLEKHLGLSQRIIKTTDISDRDDLIFKKFILSTGDVSYLNHKAMLIIYDLKTISKKEVIEKHEIRKDNWVFKKNSYPNERIFAEIFSFQEYTSMVILCQAQK